MQTPKEQPSYDILHVSAGCWVNGAGLSEAIALLALAQARVGKRVAVTFLDDHPEHPTLQRCRAAGVTVIPIHRTLREPFYFSLNLIRQLPSLVAQSAQVVIHGAWTFPIAWAARCARKAKVPYIVFPHGSLNPTMRRYGRLRKTLSWYLFNANVLRHATWLHAASEREASWARDLLGANCPPIKCIPLGVDGELLDAVPPQPRTKTFLYLGRNHPLKGLDLLLQAWKAANLGNDWQLLIAGFAPPSGAKPAEVWKFGSLEAWSADASSETPLGWCTSPSSAMTRSRGTPQERQELRSLLYLGELRGEAKVQALKSVACLVLPTRSENFGLVVAEALWCETPVICTKGAPWEELGDFWVDVSVPALTEALQKMAALSEEERATRFAPLFTSARKRFAWEALASL